MNKKLAFVSLLSFLALVSSLQSVKAATIPSATLDSDVYLAGQTGDISVSVYNDESAIIRVTELSASVNYYYTDGTVYIQKFFTDSDLPDEIQVGQTTSYNIPISLPTNIANGYMTMTVEARTEMWAAQSEHWVSSDRPTYPVKLYVESPYKQLYETSQDELGSTENQLQEQQLLSGNLNSMVIMFAATTLVFAAAAAFLGFYMFSRKAKAVPQP